MILYFPVNVKDLFVRGRAYHWEKPKRCPVCNSRRLWWHGFVLRCFRGYAAKIWVRRCFCPDCGRVHTLRPDSHWARLQSSRFCILRAVVSRLVRDRWRSDVPRQSQQYWFGGLVFQASRLENMLKPSMSFLRRLLAVPIIAVTHSLDCAIIRC